MVRLSSEGMQAMWKQALANEHWDTISYATEQYLHSDSCLA